jgi:hypothetical protein
MPGAPFRDAAMMMKITGQALYCRKYAARCRRLGLREMERHWLRLAEAYELAEKVSGYIAWQAQRVAPPPGVRL